MCYYGFNKLTPLKLLRRGKRQVYRFMRKYWPNSRTYRLDVIESREQQQKQLRRNPSGFVKNLRLLFGRFTEVETGKDREGEKKKGGCHSTEALGWI